MEKGTVWFKGQFGITPFYDKVFDSLQEAGFWISGYGNDKTGMFITFCEHNTDSKPKEEKMSEKWSIREYGYKGTGVPNDWGIHDGDGELMCKLTYRHIAECIVDEHNATMKDADSNSEWTDPLIVPEDFLAVDQEPEKSSMLKEDGNGIEDKKFPVKYIWSDLTDSYDAFRQEPKTMTGYSYFATVTKNELAKHQKKLGDTLSSHSPKTSILEQEWHIGSDGCMFDANDDFVLFNLEVNKYRKEITAYPDVMRAFVEIMEIVRREPALDAILTPELVGKGIAALRKAGVE